MKLSRESGIAAESAPFEELNGLMVGTGLAEDVGTEEFEGVEVTGCDTFAGREPGAFTTPLLNNTGC
jgi:hypothetical protein